MSKMVDNGTLSEQAYWRAWTREIDAYADALETARLMDVPLNAVWPADNLAEAALQGALWKRCQLQAERNGKQATASSGLSADPAGELRGAGSGDSVRSPDDCRGQ